jgi:hypothetical protein
VNSQGVQQGDPLSLIFSDFMVDSLVVVIFWASEAGHIPRVMSHLIPRGVTHQQYADHTKILIEPWDEGIVNLKLILLFFENM